MSSPTIISEVDSNFVQNYHTNKGHYELLHMCWAQVFLASIKGSRGSQKTSDRLIVLTQLRLLLVKPKTFGGKRVVEREFMLTGLRKARMRCLNRFFEITMVLEGEEELVIVTRVSDDCEKFCKGIVQTVGILSQVVPSYKADIDFPEDVRRNSGVPGRLDNVQKVEFSYKLHCAFAEVMQKDSILNKLVGAVKSGSPIFQPFEMLDGSKDRNDINVVVNCVQNVDCFNSIRVEGVAIRSDTLREIGKVVVVNNFIIDVELPNCSLTKDSFSSFTKPFERAKRRPIRLLNLSRNPLANVGDCFEPLSSAEVDRFVLAECKLNKKSIKGLLPLLISKNWLADGGLRVLILSFNDLGKKGSQELVPFLRSTECLEELDLAGAGAELTCILQAIERNKILSTNKLRILDISRNKMTPFGAVALADLLESSRSIQRVNLRDTGLNKSSFEHIISKVPKNTSGTEMDIDISDNKLGHYAGEVFSSLNGMGDAIVSLTLANNSLGESKEFEAIMSCMSSARNLRFLNLDFNFKANKKQLHLVKIQALARCIEKLPKLEFLSIMGDKSNQKLALTGGELVPIANLITTKMSLRVLNLAGNRLQDEGVKALSDSLMVNTTLQSIDIEGNKLTFENMQTFIGGIQQTSHLLGTLPSDTLNRLWNEKKRNREIIDAWVERLNKIFQRNLEKEQKDNEEKEDVPALSVIPGYDGYYPPINSAPGSHIPTRIRERVSKATQKKPLAEAERKSDIGKRSSQGEGETACGEGEATTHSRNLVAAFSPKNAQEEEKVWEISNERSQLTADHSRATYPSHKPQGNALALSLLLKTASASPPSINYEHKEGEISANKGMVYSLSLDDRSNEIIVLDAPQISNEGYQTTKGSTEVNNNSPVPLPPPIPAGQEPAKPKNNEQLRQSLARTPSPIKNGPFKFKGSEGKEQTPVKRKSPSSLKGRVAKFENMKLMGMKPKSKSANKRVVKVDLEAKPRPLPGLGHVKSMPLNRYGHSRIIRSRSYDDEKKSQLEEKVDVSKMIASRPKITRKTKRRRRKRGRLPKKKKSTTGVS